MTQEATIAISPSPELLLFAERWAQEETPCPLAVENRSEDRPSLFVQVVAQPLNKDLTPVGDPLAALTRNISRHGLSIVVEDWPRPDLLAVQLVLEGKQCCLLVNEKWRKEEAPFAIVGLRTVKQLQAHTFPRFVDGSFSHVR